MFDQWNSNIHIKCIARSMRRVGNRNMDIYGCMCKNDHTNKNNNGQSCTGSSVCNSSTDNSCLWSSSNKFAQLYQQCKRNMFNKWNSDIHIKCTAWSMWRNSNRDLDIYRCLCKNDHTDKNNNS